MKTFEEKVMEKTNALLKKIEEAHQNVKKTLAETRELRVQVDEFVEDVRAEKIARLQERLTKPKTENE